MKKKENRARLLSLLLSVFMILVFIGIIFIYYLMFYRSTRNNIISSGKINAISSSEQVNKHLSTSTDILKLAAYTLDNMIRDGRSGEEILDYITNQTVAVGDALIANTTGIYGYIYGEYMDGSGWEPGEGYDPTQRPWYVEAKANNGRITIVDPYVDLDTGTIMIAIVKMLCDNRSVVGIDFSMDKLQSIVEDHAKQNSSYSEMIINDKGQIIAHSDISRIGTGDPDSADTLESVIISTLDHADENYYYQTFGDTDYIVYVMPLDNGWTDISIIDTTESLKSLQRPFYVTMVTAVIMTSILLYYMISSDIKGKKARALADETARAMAASEAKSAFLSNMSHEIRTPINAILGMNEMIQRECPEGNIINYSNNIQNAGSTLLSLVNEILDFSKIEAGKMEIIPVDYSPASVVADLMNLIRPKADAKGLKLIGDFDPNIPRELHGDEIRIKQVITNLLSNAVKYTSSGSIVLSIGFEKIKKEEGQKDQIFLAVSVKDTGIGIKQEDLGKLFTKFDRLEEKRNRNIEGTGLGLNISRMLLGMMGSELEVESTYGKGSCFSFNLRQEVVDPAPIRDYKIALDQLTTVRKNSGLRFTAPNADVLVVDDTPMNLSVFSSLLKRTKVLVDTRDNGDEAVSAARNKKYDIIFLDHMMPGKDGIETLHEIKKDPASMNPDTPIVCLTANALSGAKEEYIKAGFDGYLSKPIDAGMLEEMLISYLPAFKIRRVESFGESEESSENKLLNIPEIEGLDTQKGIDNCGSPEDYIKTLRTYTEMIDDEADEAEKLIAQGEYDQATVKIHAMKSTTRIIGGTDLGEVAQKLENEGKSGEIQALKNEAGEFFKKCRELKKQIVQALDEFPETEEKKVPISKDGVYRIYADIDEAIDMIEVFKEYEIPEEEQERVGLIIKAANIFDYDTISGLLP